MTPVFTPGAHPLRVLIADEDEAALEGLRRVLEEQLGHEVVSFAVTAGEAAERISREDPDVAFVMVHDDDEHALTLIEQAVGTASGPVIAHGSNGHGQDFVSRAAERGISAYTRSDDPAGIQGAIDVALRRYADRRHLGEKVDQLEDAMTRRASIERAKGILMERHGLDDGEAFERLRAHARSSRTRVADVAQRVASGDVDLP